MTIPYMFTSYGTLPQLEVKRRAAWHAKWQNTIKPWGPWRNWNADDATTAFYQELGKPPPAAVIECQSPAAFTILCQLVTTYRFTECSLLDLKTRLDEDVFTRDEGDGWGPFSKELYGDVVEALDSVRGIRPGKSLMRRHANRIFHPRRYDELTRCWTNSLQNVPRENNGRTTAWAAIFGSYIAMVRRRYCCREADFNPTPSVTFYRGDRASEVASYLFKLGGGYPGDAIDRILVNIRRRWQTYYAFENIAILCNFPTKVALDAQGRCHDEAGYAAEWADGFRLRALGGMLAPEWAWEKRHFKPATIRKVNNVELRRVLIAKYGLGKYLVDSGATVVDECGPKHPLVGLRNARLLYLPPLGAEQEDYYVVELVNSTPEPDGTSKLYHLRVDPHQYGGRAGREVRAAAASTFREHGNRNQLVFLHPEDYHPLVES